MTNKLNAKLDGLINEVVTGIIKGRLITDVIAAAQEIISDCFRENIKGGMLLKLDFAKAYDMLDWNFILEVLRARKFEAKWISWIDKCLKGGKSHILVNGSSRRMICLKEA